MFNFGLKSRNKSLPKTGLLMQIKAPGMVDSIGVSSIGIDLTFDYFISPTGDDANNGLSSAASWKSLSKIPTITIAAGQTKRVYVATGTYDTALDYVAFGVVDIAGAVLNIVFAPGCVMDGTNTALKDGFEASGVSAWTINIYGNGLKVNNYKDASAVTSPNGVGNRGYSIIHAYDVYVNAANDGFSSHNNAQIHCHRCIAVECLKAPFNHVDSAKFYAYNSIFVEKVGGSSIDLGGSYTATVQQTLEDCAIIPDSNASQLRIDNTVLTRCRIGTLTKSVWLATTAAASPATITDCFVNAYSDGNTKIAYSSVFGKLSLRMRNTGETSVLRSVIVGPASGKTAFIYSDYDPGSSSKYIINNNIFKGNWTFDSLQTSTKAAYLFTALSEFKNNVLHGGVAYSAMLTTAGGESIAGTITTDPLLGAINTQFMSDYAFASGSPAIAAGLGGVDIGFGTADVDELRHDSALRAGFDIVSGTTPADWVVKLQLSSKLFIALGIGSYYSGAGVPQEITWATHVDNTQVRLGDKYAVAYGYPQTAANIIKIDKYIVN